MVLSHRVESDLATIHGVRLLLVERSSMTLSPWYRSLVLSHWFVVSRMPPLVSHSLVAHMMWLSVHLRVASDVVFGLVVAIVSLLLSRTVLSPHLVWSHSAHAVQSLTLSLLLLLLLDQPSLHFSLLLSLHGFLLSSLVLLPFVITLVKHITDLSKMIDLRVSTIESIILIGRLHILISLFFLS